MGLEQVQPGKYNLPSDYLSASDLLSHGPVADVLNPCIESIVLFGRIVEGLVLKERALPHSQNQPRIGNNDNKFLNIYDLYDKMLEGFLTSYFPTFKRGFGVLPICNSRLYFSQASSISNPSDIVSCLKREPFSFLVSQITPELEHI